MNTLSNSAIDVGYSIFPSMSSALDFQFTFDGSGIYDWVIPNADKIQIDSLVMADEVSFVCLPERYEFDNTTMVRFRATDLVEGANKRFNGVYR